MVSDVSVGRFETFKDGRTLIPVDHGSPSGELLGGPSARGPSGQLLRTDEKLDGNFDFWRKDLKR